MLRMLGTGDYKQVDAHARANSPRIAALPWLHYKPQGQLGPPTTLTRDQPSDAQVSKPNVWSVVALETLRATPPGAPTLTNSHQYVRLCRPDAVMFIHTVAGTPTLKVMSVALRTLGATTAKPYEVWLTLACSTRWGRRACGLGCGAKLAGSAAHAARGMHAGKSVLGLHAPAPHTRAPHRSDGLHGIPCCQAPARSQRPASVLSRSSRSHRQSHWAGARPPLMRCKCTLTRGGERGDVLRDLAATMRRSPSLHQHSAKHGLGHCAKWHAVMHDAALRARRPQPPQSRQRMLRLAAGAAAQRTGRHPSVLLGPRPPSASGCPTTAACPRRW